MVNWFYDCHALINPIMHLVGLLPNKLRHQTIAFLSLDSIELLFKTPFIHFTFNTALIFAINIQHERASLEFIVEI